jgi:D-glycero-D-manno-heptose 1,7-bisphosphate phosphatase
VRRKPALFLDRDGVILEEAHYLSDPDQVRLMAGAAEALARVRRAGVPVVVVTNQSGVARGYFPENRVAAVHVRLNEILAPCGAEVDRFYFCPHHPKEGIGSYRLACECRKPAPGMLLRAAAELHLDLSRSFMVGDKICDVQAGARAGCRTILVRTGYGDDHARNVHLAEHGLAFMAQDLAQAVDFCLPQLTESRPSA